MKPALLLLLHIVLETGFPSIDAEGILREESIRTREIRETRSVGQVTITAKCIPRKYGYQSLPPCHLQNIN